MGYWRAKERCREEGAWRGKRERKLAVRRRKQDQEMWALRKKERTPSPSKKILAEERKVKGVC